MSIFDQVATAPMLRGVTCNDYHVAILCALSIELLAVRALFDETHEQIQTAQEDTNHYALGQMAQHFIVTTCLPSAEYGTNAASAVMQNLRRSFPRVETCLLVGIGGGVPSGENDIRLGDVVVSHPIGAHPAVLQYDMGKILDNGDFERTGRLQEPPRLLMTAISNLKSNPNPGANPLQSFLEIIGEGRSSYQLPGGEKDVLFAADSPHQTTDSHCQQCEGELIDRSVRESDQPRIFYGPIGSGNQVMKSAKIRDCLRARHKILCFEMEAAGVMNLIPCLVIRGICDYADSHKNKVWQEYPAAAAASYAKLLLSVLRSYLDTGPNANHSNEPTSTSSKNSSLANNIHGDRTTRTSLPSRKVPLELGECPLLNIVIVIGSHSINPYFYELFDPKKMRNRF
jgi:nucleoside phosphorylase